MTDRESRLSSTDNDRPWRLRARSGVDKVRQLQAQPLIGAACLGTAGALARAKLVVGRVTFTPRSQPKQWELRGRGTIAGLFEAVFPLGMASPTGFEPVS